VHQDRVASLDRGHVQHLRGGRGCQQEVGGLPEGETTWLGEHVARWDVHVAGPPAKHPESEHLITDLATA
jgi:hypothetical protein